MANVNNEMYSIKEVANLSGLPSSTLRYYESIGIIEPIERDGNSKHRRYSEDDLNTAISIACLNATGMSLDDMRTYMRNRSRGKSGASEQIGLLEAQQKRLAVEEKRLKLRREYVDLKIACWLAVKADQPKKAIGIAKDAEKLTKKLRSPI